MWTGFAALVGTVISLIAFTVSIFALVDGKRRDRRDLLLRLHEQLISEEHQVGRRLLYQMGGRPIAQLDQNEFSQINAALALFDVLGLYVHRKYVRRQDALQLWAVPTVLAWRAAQPFIEYRAAEHSYRPWPYFEELAAAAEVELRRLDSPLVT
jgi:hypothetical protein